MRVRFTKMQGAGNDFVMLDGTAAPLALSDAQLRHLADRRLGIGADQILLVERSRTPGVDFRYRIFNGASGDEVEQCGNGARCFAVFVRERGLTDQRALKVETRTRVLELRLGENGQVSVDMGVPVFEPAQVPFDPSGLRPRAGAAVAPAGGAAAGSASPAASAAPAALAPASGVSGAPPAPAFPLWPLDVGDQSVDVAVLSMGNPHAVLLVEEVDSAPVGSIGPALQADAQRFPTGVNVGFLQIVDRSHARLRVYERGAGETLACGTGACAAVVAGIRLGRLDARVEVEARGGVLTIEWPGGDAPVRMAGPATTVFVGEIEL